MLNRSSSLVGSIALLACTLLCAPLTTATFYLLSTYTDATCTTISYQGYYLNATCQEQTGGSDMLSATGPSTVLYQLWLGSGNCSGSPSFSSLTIGICGGVNAIATVVNPSHMLQRNHYSDSSCTTLVGIEFWPASTCIQQYLFAAKAFSYVVTSAVSVKMELWIYPNCSYSYASGIHDTGLSNGVCLSEKSYSPAQYVIYTIPNLAISSSGSAGGCCSSSSGASGLGTSSGTSGGGADGGTSSSGANSARSSSSSSSSSGQGCFNTTQTCAGTRRVSTAWIVGLISSRCWFCHNWVTRLSVMPARPSKDSLLTFECDGLTS